MFQPGEIIAGKYTIEREIGQGGMGTIYAARHEALGRLEALKCMKPEVCRDRADIERFIREARAAGQLKSEHAITIFDVAQLDNGAPYIAMEYLEGKDLDKLLRERGPLPADEAVNYVMQACDAVAEAHSMGIVHRDLKPANLFLATGAHGMQRVKVLDFGIAKFLSASDSPDNACATQAGFAMGSALYMPPEQVASAKYADARSDIWALGVILFRLLTREMPFQSNGAIPRALLVMSQDPISPLHFRKDIPIELADIIMQCLKRDPAERFQSVAELVRQLLPYSTGNFRNSTVFSGGDAKTLPLKKANEPRTKTQVPVGPVGLEGLEAAVIVPSPKNAKTLPNPRNVEAAAENAPRERTEAPALANTIRPPGGASRARLILAAVGVVLSIGCLVLGLTFYAISRSNTIELSSPAATEAAPEQKAIEPLIPTESFIPKALESAAVSKSDEAKTVNTNKLTTAPIIKGEMEAAQVAQRREEKPKAISPPKAEPADTAQKAPETAAIPPESKAQESKPEAVPHKKTQTPEDF